MKENETLSFPGDGPITVNISVFTGVKLGDLEIEPADIADKDIFKFCFFLNDR